MPVVQHRAHAGNLGQEAKSSVVETYHRAVCTMSSQAPDMNIQQQHGRVQLCHIFCQHSPEHNSNMLRSSSLPTPYPVSHKLSLGSLEGSQTPRFRSPPRTPQERLRLTRAATADQSESVAAQLFLVRSQPTVPSPTSFRIDTKKTLQTVAYRSVSTAMGVWSPACLPRYLYHMPQDPVLYDNRNWMSMLQSSSAPQVPPDTYAKSWVHGS